MADLALYAFNAADWDYEYSSMLRLQRPGDTYPSLAPFYLLDHPEGTVLVDTGVSYDLIENPAEYGAYGAPHVAEFAAPDIEMGPADRAVAQLREQGVAPDDVDYVVLTHLHLDHAGGITDFPDAEFLVQRAELEYAWWPADPIQRQLYVEGDFGPLRSPDYEVTELAGRHDVFGDGTVECIPTPGHSRGHQSVLVDLPETGSVVLAGDLAFTEEALARDLQPPFAWDTEVALDSVRTVRDIARRTGAEVSLAHDRDHFEALPDPPDALR